MKSNVKIFLFSLAALIMIISFQNCIQEEGLGGVDPSLLTPPPAEPTPTISKHGAQCTPPTYYGTKNCTSPSVSFMFKDLPVDTLGQPSAATVIVPDGCTFMVVKIWGAGGGASASNSGVYGGSGAFVSGTIPVGPGESLKVIVGQGGSPSGGQTFGGGGASGTINGIPSSGGSGGGRSAIVRGYYDIVTAGGGGGAAAHTVGGYAGFTPANGTTHNVGGGSVAYGGGAATNGDATNIAKAGTAGTSSAAGGNGSAGSIFQGGNGGPGNPGSGGGGGGYFGGGGGASTGMQNPQPAFSSSGGGGASYIGCGNLNVSGVDKKTAGYSDNAADVIPGFNAPPIAGLFSTCEIPSRGGGTVNSTGVSTCSGVSKGSDGFVYIEWK